MLRIRLDLAAVDHNILGLSRFTSEKFESIFYRQHYCSCKPFVSLFCNPSSHFSCASSPTFLSHSTVFCLAKFETRLYSSAFVISFSKASSQGLIFWSLIT